jgi:acetyl esterase
MGPHATRDGAGYREETDALLAGVEVQDGPIDYADLVASRSEPADPDLAGPLTELAVCAEVLLPLTAGPTRVRVYRGDTGGPVPLLLWLHGGGFVGGSLDDIDATCRAIAAAAPAVLVSLDYRLAPEHPFPAALEDTYDALCWLAEHGPLLGGDGRIAAGGQSAGANLVAAACLLARDRGGPRIDRQVLCYPHLEMDHESESRRLFDGILHGRAGMDWDIEQYLDGQPVTPLVAPLTATTLAGLPPALILAAGRDPLRDDARRYRQRLEADGVDTVFVEYANTMHAFLNFPGVLSAARDAAGDIARDLTRSFDSSRRPSRRAVS